MDTLRAFRWLTEASIGLLVLLAVSVYFDPQLPVPVKDWYQNEANGSLFRWMNEAIGDQHTLLIAILLRRPVASHRHAVRTPDAETLGARDVSRHHPDRLRDHAFSAPTSARLLRPWLAAVPAFATPPSNIAAGLKQSTIRPVFVEVSMRSPRFVTVIAGALIEPFAPAVGVRKPLQCSRCCSSSPSAAASNRRNSRMGDFALPEQASAILVALGAGLLIGIERERRMADGSTPAMAGVRTFAITALLGVFAALSGSDHPARRGRRLASCCSPRSPISSPKARIPA